MCWSSPDGDSEDGLIDEEAGRTYITPVLNSHPLTSTSISSSSLHPTHTQRIEHQHEVHRIRSELVDGSASSVATITTDIVTVTPALDDDLLAPPSPSSSQHQLAETHSLTPPSQVTFELLDDAHTAASTHPFNSHATSSTISTTPIIEPVHPIIDEPVQAEPQSNNDSEPLLATSASSSQVGTNGLDDLPASSHTSTDRDQNEVEPEESTDASTVTSTASAAAATNQGKKKKNKNKKR